MKNNYKLDLEKIGKVCLGICLLSVCNVSMLIAAYLRVQKLLKILKIRLSKVAEFRSLKKHHKK